MYIQKCFRLKDECIKGKKLTNYLFTELFYVKTIIVEDEIAERILHIYSFSDYYLDVSCHRSIEFAITGSRYIYAEHVSIENNSPLSMNGHVYLIQSL